MYVSVSAHGRAVRAVAHTPLPSPRQSGRYERVFRLVPWQLIFGTRNFQRVPSDKQRAGRLWRERPSMYGTTRPGEEGRRQPVSPYVRPSVRPTSRSFASQCVLVAFCPVAGAAWDVRRLVEGGRDMGQLCRVCFAYLVITPAPVIGDDGWCMGRAAIPAECDAPPWLGRVLAVLVLRQH
ncbi:hypothetical protein GGTG_13624 [Gaeumannomyces tritici R3-111a-1]|uniref:Uncharacterized protein n=1 Tax=Gaeumannomyces tritici (strain R3-111a-1) TaxID=644352 RepID=J3PJE4_GAET3|nr:hypothetical protein GGTG_13624 [Gaeumannomyces tritici R3-111a-1]EJT68810.1 hypothetical protein GGTG_13624 [Gaeumannomyces tritici R3-111a-1]